MEEIINMLDTSSIKNKKNNKNYKSKKKSEFTIIPKEQMEFFGKMIMLKQISYKKLLEKIKEDFNEINTKRPETLRYFMITNHYVLNQKSLDNINFNIEKSKMIQKKRKNIIESLMEQILIDDDFLNALFSNEIVVNKIKDLLKD